MTVDVEQIETPASPHRATTPDPLNLRVPTRATPHERVDEARIPGDPETPATSHTLADSAGRGGEASGGDANGAAEGPSSAAPSGSPVPLEALGFGGPNRYMGTSRDVERTAREDADALERGVADALLRHDTGIGLGAEGPVLAALESATGTSTAPVNSRAVFRVSTDAEGSVTEFVVLDASQDRRSWDDIAGRVTGDLRGKRLRVPRRGKGVTMRIEVESAWKLPSGHDPGVEMDVFGIPLHRGEGKQSTKISILNPIPKIVHSESPNPDTNSGVKLPSQSIQFTILGIGGDPADIGARPRRVVHAKVLEEHAL